MNLRMGSRTCKYFMSLIIGARLPGFASGSPLYGSVTMEKTFYLSGSHESKTVVKIY